jgi:dUTP pyrophosphatase
MDYTVDSTYPIKPEDFTPMPMKVRFKKLDEKAVAPSKAHPTDAGFDLTAISVKDDGVRNIVTYGTGIAVEIPDGYVGLIFPRSSICKKSLSLSNSVGVIDSSYRGEIMFKFRKEQPHIQRYSVGDRIGQMIIIPYPDIEFVEANELSDSDRGTGGFGSTGK